MQGRLNQVRAVFCSRTPAQMLATAAPFKNLFTVLNRPEIHLAARHAKIRRDGYRVARTHQEGRR